MKTVLIAVLFAFGLSGCATLERWVDDVYDGDPRMTEIKQQIDDLRENLKAARDDAREKLKIRLGILREEAEMLGDLKKAEFNTKLNEMKAQLAAVREVIDSQ